MRSLLPHLGGDGGEGSQGDQEAGEHGPGIRRDLDEDSEGIDFARHGRPTVVMVQKLGVLALWSVLPQVVLVEVRPGGDGVGHESTEEEDHGGDEAEEAALLCGGPEGEEDDVTAAGEYSADRLAAEHGAHVGGRELARHPQDPALEDGGVDVDQDDGPERQPEELVLPVVGVNLHHDAGEGEQEDDEDEADNQSRLSLELVSEESIENEEGDVWHHGGGREVTSPGLLQVI